MKKIIYLTVIGCIVSFSMHAQSYKKIVDAAFSEYNDGNYHGAAQLFKQALESEGSDLDIWYQYGLALKNQKAFGAAKSAFEYIVVDKNNSKNPDAIFQLAELYRIDEQYEASAKYYKLYLEMYEGQNQETDKKVDLGLRSAIWVQDQLDLPVKNVTHLGEGVNTTDSEHSPVYNDSTLSFASLRFGSDESLKRSRILEKQDDADGSEVAKEVPNFNKAADITSNPAFSATGDLMFYTICNYDENDDIICEIYYRKKTNKLYELGYSAGDGVNKAGFTSTQPAVVDLDGKRFLYFVSNRPGSVGGTDIWRSEFSENMQFGAPINLSSINTEYDELTPHFQKSTNTLFYSTNGLEGFGSFDVYKREHLGGHEFGEPVNMGLSINSSYDDIFYFISEDGKQAYLSSNRKGSLYSEDGFETCCYDIYQVEPEKCEIDLYALVFDKVDQSEINDARIVIKNKKTGDVVYDRILTGTHKAEAYLDCTEDYTITASKDGYVSSTVDLNFSKDGFELNGGSHEEQLYLEPAIVTLNLDIKDLETDEALNGATIVLVDEETGEEFTKTNETGNDYVFSVKPGKNYLIRMTKLGYIPGTDAVKIGLGQKVVNKTVYLQKTPIEKKIVTLEKVLPIKLFFDNDHPNPKTMSETTDIMYEETYIPYYAKKEKFKRNYAGKFRGNERYLAEQRIDDFFENELKRNHDNMAEFTSTLLEVLQAGRTVNLFFRGFASPLSVSEYNYNLGKRRVESMLLEFKRFNGGLFLPYIESGQIILTERSFGESSAPTGISDDFNDPSKSIYSPEASYERRVEIQEINVNRQ